MSKKYAEAKAKFRNKVKLAAVWPERKAAYVPRELVNGEEKPIVQDILCGKYGRGLSNQDGIDLLKIRPDLWAAIQGYVKQEFTGHFVPRWLFEKLCAQHGMGSKTDLMLIEHGKTIHVVRSAK